MKSLEVWRSQQSFTPEVDDLFNESLLCYSASAYKGALIFAYLAFMNVIRDRITNSDTPKGFTLKAWTQKKRDVTNAETWDSKTYDTIRQISPAPVFTNNDDLRNQLEFWKNRRNDCAHSKPNKIERGHVESYYSFIMSNLSKFVVNGSKDQIINNIKTHYDLSLTPANQPIDYIVKDLQNGLSKNEYDVFFEEVVLILDGMQTPYEKMINMAPKNKINFCLSVFKKGDHDIQ
uniref:hypothetical protein n=2 Tax=Yersinia TaxID=629 RepID=UPI0011A5FE16